MKIAVFVALLLADGVARADCTPTPYSFWDTRTPFVSGCAVVVASARASSVGKLILHVEEVLRPQRAVFVPGDVRARWTQLDIELCGVGRPPRPPPPVLPRGERMIFVADVAPDGTLLIDPSQIYRYSRDERALMLAAIEDSEAPLRGR
jgi:hypothetical protein